MNSTNIKVMSEEIQHLKNEVHNLDVEIPAHPATDEGKYLGVTADGSLSWSKVPDELPPTTEATAGQILALDNNKAPEWVNNYNLDYSETEQATGYYCGENEVYHLYIRGELGEITEQTNKTLTLGLAQCMILSSCLLLEQAGGSVVEKNAYYFTRSNGNLVIQNIATTFSNGYYILDIYYTKPTPSALTSSDPTREAEPEIIEEIETKSTRTKKSTK